MQRRVRTRTILSSGLAAAAVLGAATPAVASTRTVLSPRAGQHLPAAPFTIRVRATGAQRLRATLNGEAIGADFGPSRRGVRTLQVSATHGLRFGANVLRVRVGRAGPRTVRFRVAANRPLASAGRDRVVAASSGVLLDARRSLPHPRTTAFAGTAGLRYRWTIVRAPGPSALTPGRRLLSSARRGGTTVAGLVGARTARPRLITDTPGSFTARVTVTARGGRKGSDLITVRADPPPSVHVVVQAKRGSDVGVRLNGPGEAGDAFFPATPNAWLQVVVLRRDELTLVSNTSIDCPQASDAPFFGDIAQVKPCTDRLAALLKPLDRSSIVIATSQPGFANGQPPVGVQIPLGRIGVVPWTWWDGSSNIFRGTFSAIGVPGAHAGTAQHVAASQKDDTAQIEGNFVRADDGDYDFAPQQQYLSTQAAGSDKNTNVVDIAGHRFVQKLGDHSNGGYHGGMQVVIADPETLQGTSYYFPIGNPFPVDDWKAMTQVLKQANNVAPLHKSPLIVITSRGRPQYAIGTPPDAGLNQALRELTDQVERAGGTRSAFMDTIAPATSASTHRVSYTLVGHGSAHEGSGQESVGPAPVNDTLDERNTRPIVGTIAQTGQYMGYQPRTLVPAGVDGGTAAPSGSMQLVRAAGAAPTAWPDAGDAGRRAAVRWLGEQVLGTDDPRSQYWTLPYASATWDAIAAKIADKGKAYVKNADFDASDLTWASNELQQEIGWLKTSYEYLKSLAEPFQSSVFSSWADMQKIAADVRAKVDVASDAKSIASTELVFKFLRTLANEIPVFGKAFTVLNEMYDAALEQAQIDRGEAAEDDFPVAAGEVGKELAARFEEAQAFLTKQLPRAIVSDYGRLRLVGSCASALHDDWAACPTDHALWQFTQSDQDQAARGLLRGSNITAYGSLLRAKYTLYRLPESHHTTANTGFAGITYFTCRVPFVLAPATGQYAKPMLRDMVNGGQDDRNAILAFGALRGEGIIGHPFEMAVPQASVTDQLFGTGPGQLAADREALLDRFFRPETLEHFNEKDTPVGWKTECGA